MSELYTVHVVYPREKRARYHYMKTFVVMAPHKSAARIWLENHGVDLRSEVGIEVICIHEPDGYTSHASRMIDHAHLISLRQTARES